MVEVETDLCVSVASMLEVGADRTVCSRLVQLGFEYLQGRRLHKGFACNKDKLL